MRKSRSTMPSSKSARACAQEQQLLRVKEVVVCHAKRRGHATLCRCCNRKYLALPFAGVTLFAIGFLLEIGYFSIKRVTSSVLHTEGLVPSYLTGALLAVTGIQLFVMFKTRPKQLIVLSIICTVLSGMLCFAGALYNGSEIAPLLSKLDTCQYYPTENSCKCFHQAEFQQISFIFRDTTNCNRIKHSLAKLAYGMCGVYASGMIMCVVATVLEALLLCPKRVSKVSLHSRSDGDGKCTVSSKQSQTSQTDLASKSEDEVDVEAATPAASAEPSPVSTPKRDSLKRDSLKRDSVASARVTGDTCSHYVVDLSMDRRDFCINYNKRRHGRDPRHDPPPPYSERPVITA